MAVFTNQATLTYGGITTTSNVVTGEVVGTLSVTKTSVSDTYGAGGRVTYIVSVMNSGTADATGITVTDDLGTYTDGAETYVPLSYVDGTAKLFVNGVPAPDPTATGGDTLVFSGLTVPAGGGIILVYETDVTGQADITSTGSITNTATVAGATVDPVSASATVTAETGPVLTVGKALAPQTVRENGTITYTFTVTNTGNTAADAATGAVLADTFDPALTGIAVTKDGETWDAGNYQYDEQTGVFSTTAGALTVPAATFTRGADGSFVTDPGVTVLTVSGTV
ncbi:MAG: DUF11 domain-containing protein [Clostridia bacterium]|nr:DUF11 domain-containing protein [Clostridia bacterium]